jgi:hypothetical protein
MTLFNVNVIKRTAWCGVVSALSFHVVHVQSVTVTVKNSCQFDIWPAYASFGKAASAHGGWEMKTGSAPVDIEIPSKWEGGRIWARTVCDRSVFGTGKKACKVGDCQEGLLEW